jgi:uncharacterized protein YkwD
MKKNAYLVLLSLLIFSLPLYAQNPNDKIDLKHFNGRYLETLILEKINAVRDSLVYAPLAQDSILELAARNHSIYIRKTDDLNHLQPTPAFATLEKRVEHFKGTQEAVAEIMEVIYLDKPSEIYKENQTIKVTTYEEAAYFYFKNAYNTSAHYDILTRKAFYTSGIAFTINEDRKCIYVVQVFGTKPYRFAPFVAQKENRKFFYPSKKANIENAYGLLPYSDKTCRRCVDRFNLIPNYIQYGFTIENQNIYFNFSDAAAFEKLFPDGDEAIAADVLHKEQFRCHTGNALHRSFAHDGILFRPQTKAEMIKNNLVKESGKIKVLMGPCPYTNPAEYELALVLIKTNTFCDYKINLPEATYLSQIMETDLYTDTLSKSEILKRKNLRFSIPFERSKAAFNARDIQPFYDSLNLNKFNIKELVILAYSSVEGSAEKNLELQKQRAQSIVKVLQSFQLDSIKTVIRTLENWDQFLRDIKGTPHAWLASLDKASIKEKLQQDSLLQALEPYLKKGRRAFVTLKVVEKIDLAGDKQELLKHYMNALLKKDAANASIMQSALFDAVQAEELTYDQVGLIAIPKTKEFAQMLNNDLVFRYSAKLGGDYVKELEEISALDPSNAFIKFNLYNVQLKSWSDGTLVVSNPDPILKNIKTLFNSKVDKKMVNQLYLNYYMLASDFYWAGQKYKYRDDAVGLVKKYYKTIEATPADYLVLANYFAKYGRKDYATEVLQSVVQSGECPEDALFAYLSYSLAEPNQYEKNAVVPLMKQAQQQNPEKFCMLYGKDKVAFQLFKNEELKELYCTHCNPQ